MTMLYENDSKKIGGVQLNPTDQDWQLADAILNAPVHRAKEHCGTMVESIIDAFLSTTVRAQAREDGYDFIANVSVHELEPGDYPRRPGWAERMQYHRADFGCQAMAVEKHLVSFVSEHEHNTVLEVPMEPTDLPFQDDAPRIGQIEELMEGLGPKTTLVESGDLMDLGSTGLVKWLPAQERGRLLVVELFKLAKSDIAKFPANAIDTSPVVTIWRQARPMIFV
jgi:hypothetical protein